MKSQNCLRTANEEITQKRVINEQIQLDEEHAEKERKAVQACVAFYHLLNPYINEKTMPATSKSQMRTFVQSDAVT